MKFENYRTIEELKKETFSEQANPKKVTKKDVNGIYQPVCYTNAKGELTNVQKIALVNEAHKTIAWCSLSLAQAIYSGKRPAIMVVDCIDEETGMAYPDRACLSSVKSDFDDLTF